MKHMAVYEVAFNTYKVIAPGHVYLGDDSIREAIGMGSIVVKALVKDKIKKICIKKIHVPKLQANLLLVSKIMLNGLKMQFNLNECIADL